jgi:predicted RNA-binding protein with PUA-like domain
MNYWIFKCNPKQYMIDERLEDQEPRTTWQITRYKEKITLGDVAFIWKTGNERGICAVISIDSYPIEIPELEQEASEKNSSKRKRLPPVGIGWCFATASATRSKKRLMR